MNKFTRDDFADSSYRLMDIIGNNAFLELENRRTYYQAAFTAINSLNNNFSVDESKKIEDQKLVFTLGDSLSFDLTLKNHFDKTLIKLSLIETDAYDKKYISEEFSYHCTLAIDEQFSDTEEMINRRHWRDHFKHILTLLVERVISHS